MNNATTVFLAMILNAMYIGIWWLSRATVMRRYRLLLKLRDADFPNQTRDSLARKIRSKVQLTRSLLLITDLAAVASYAEIVDNPSRHLSLLLIPLNLLFLASLEPRIQIRRCRKMIERFDPNRQRDLPHPQGISCDDAQYILRRFWQDNGEFNPNVDRALSHKNDCPECRRLNDRIQDESFMEFLGK